MRRVMRYERGERRTIRNPCIEMVKLVEIRFRKISILVSLSLKAWETFRGMSGDI